MANIIHSYKHFEENAEYGNKAKGLLFLTENKFIVPDFYLIDFKSLQKVEKKELFLDDLFEEWANEFDVEPESLWAVRSSTNVEDDEKNSFAGLFKTEINVLLSDLKKATENVIAAYNSVQLNLNIKNFSYGIIIQEMVKPDYSGVIFSHNPLNINEQNIFINLIPGLGEPLVSGKEKAFQLKLTDGKISFTNPNEEFHGQIYADSRLTDIVKKGHEIKTDLKGVFEKLIKNAKQIYKKKKQPVDIEFCIANQKIYWLQVRPISSQQNSNKIIWDNSNIIENYPGYTLPLSISFVKYSYKFTYTSMASFLGMSKNNIAKNNLLFENMVGGINGALYYNVSAWQQLLYQLPFGKKTSKIITELWGMQFAEFKKPSSSSSFFQYLQFIYHLFASFLFFKTHKTKFELNYTNTNKEFEDSNLEEKSYVELIDLCNNLIKKLGFKWIVPVLNGLFAMLSFSLLKKAYRNTRLLSENPNFINDILYSQTDVISVKIVRAFQQLNKSILENKDLTALFRDKSEEEILHILPKKHPEFSSQFNNYIKNYGERSNTGELKIETVNYKENPLGFISFLISSTSGNIHQNKEIKPFNFKEIINRYYKYRPLKKAVLVFLIKISLKRIRDRENYRFYRTKSFDLIRRIFRAMDYNLLQNQLISQKGDSLYLDFKEITNITKLDSFKNIITTRKIEYTQYNELKIYNRYIQQGNKFLPYKNKVTGNIKKNIRGTGCCSGTLTSKVLIIADNNLAEKDYSNCILVANHFEPGWINLFANASGVISERGNILSHTAILCREMGIPAIVGANGIMTSVTEGDVIQMNGASGEIIILDHA